MAAVHGLFPDPAPLAAFVEADPYGREGAVARTHADALITVIGIDQKKCVIVDLDGVLWPGVLAETGAPFAWDPEISGLYSYIGLFFGIHEALKSLKRRGIILAAVSKNDEATVRELWRYPSHYPHDRLLTPDDFVTWRVNWNDIQSIAAELGLATNTFAFIDDHPIERERVRQMMPEIAVWGEDLFSLRRILLTEPRLQQPHVTQESGARTELVKAQLGRAQARDASQSENDFLASLKIEYEVERLVTATSIDRVHELFERTTQFNTTGRKFSTAELTLALAHADTMIFTMKVRDRFGDHGLVGAAVIMNGEIIGFALSCRVIGLGVEQKFLDSILAETGLAYNEITARIVETSRNIPARNLYRDRGFTTHGDGLWKIQLREPKLARA
jgi:FkbH-like protein